uniref:Uncharacterized protein n=1 Tax=Timema poppense TaxID=170557 RepID=A0A7R9D6C9_TIMPO|nr:unnamed protein product [Timema poppensis]
MQQKPRMVRSVPRPSIAYVGQITAYGGMSGEGERMPRWKLVQAPTCTPTHTLTIMVVSPLDKKNIGLVQRLKELFLCWSLLSSQERDELDRQVLSNFSQERMSLYKPLKEALYRWELLQDTQGAPGCEPGTVSFSCDPQLEEEITNIIYTLEVLLKKLRACGSKSKNVSIINIEMCKDVGALTSNDRKSRQPGKSLSKSRAIPAHSVQSYSQLLMANSEFSVELSGYNTD